MAGHSHSHSSSSGGRWCEAEAVVEPRGLVAPRARTAGGVAVVPQAPRAELSMKAMETTTTMAKESFDPMTV